MILREKASASRCLPSTRLPSKLRVGIDPLQYSSHCTTQHLPEVVGYEVPLVAVLALNDHNSAHESDAVDLPRKLCTHTYVNEHLEACHIIWGILKHCTGYCTPACYQDE